MGTFKLKFHSVATLFCYGACYKSLTVSIQVVYRTILGASHQFSSAESGWLADRLIAVKCIFSVMARPLRCGGAVVALEGVRLGCQLPASILVPTAAFFSFPAENCRECVRWFSFKPPPFPCRDKKKIQPARGQDAFF
jgi:hypothetical protein